MSPAEKIVRAVLTHGLRLDIDDLTEAELHSQFKEVERILAEGQDPEIVLGAAMYGMDHVWPYSQGDIWDAGDLRKNLLRAKSFAAKVSKMKDVPLDRRYV